MNFLVIEGNIGAGKTTLAQILAERLEAHLVLEKFADNPFLPAFYQNPDRFAFSLEMFFLAERYHQLHREVAQAQLFHPWTIADFAFERSAVFASVTLKDHELEVFQRVFSFLKPHVPHPTHFIWLEESVSGLMLSILKRGRPFELLITEDYLRKIDEQYKAWLCTVSHVKSFITVSRAETDFVKFPELADKLVDWLREGRSGFFVP
ncbi:MAG: deoxynucleoside kinase [Flavobacteriales bacterium]|nr:deoxynucleoside kinase [Flavobacteriales bacterium]MCX7649128.1 deoxynucleoside kinase [Flavobacteriales bacterium]MDW8410535.1 deoxynucleoside kinase [Flavobacteriales bacterium]